MIVGWSKTAPFALHAMLKCGADGGFSEKLPSILICGSFRFGSFQLKFMAFLIVEIAFFTTSLAPLILLDIPLLIPSNTLNTVLFAVLIGPVILLFTASNPAFADALIPATLEKIALLIPSKILTADA